MILIYEILEKIVKICYALIVDSFLYEMERGTLWTGIDFKICIHFIHIVI